MIEGQTITRPGAECDAFYTWFDLVKEQYQENPDKVVIMPDNIKTIFTNWVNAFDGLPAQMSDTIEGDMTKGDRAALLAELNSRPEDYFAYLGFRDEYLVPAGGTKKYKGQDYSTPTSVPTLLYYDGDAKRWNTTTDYDQDIE